MGQTVQRSFNVYNHYDSSYKVMSIDISVPAGGSGGVSDIRLSGDGYFSTYEDLIADAGSEIVEIFEDSDGSSQLRSALLGYYKIRVTMVGQTGFKNYYFHVGS